MELHILHELAVIPSMLLGAAFILPLLSLGIKRKRFFDVYTFIFVLLAFIMSLRILTDVLSAKKPALYPLGGWPPPIGILYESDAFSALLAATVAGISLLIVIYSWWYLDGEKGTGYIWYYTLLLGLVGGMMGCLYTGDIFHLYVMMEVMAISAYALVAYYRARFISLEAAAKYAFIGVIATTMYFVAVTFIYGSYGTLNMADLALRARTSPPTSLLGATLVDEFSKNTKLLAITSCISTVLAVWVFMYLAAVFPNHFWLPDAHPEAPTPISAALSGLVVGVGVYLATRWLYTVFGPDSILSAATIGGVPVRDAIMIILMIFGAISSIIGALLMNVQRDVKRLLAYSTIGHIGLMFMALSVGLSNVPEEVRVLAVAAVAYHWINHAVGKSLAFMSAGILIEKTGTRDLTKWRGLSRVDPLASATLIISSLQLLGAPPFGGFFSKLMMFQAFIAANIPWAALVLVLESAISLVAYIKLILATTGSQTAVAGGGKGHIIASAYLATSILALACIALGILYLSGHIPTNLVNYIANALSSSGTKSFIEAAKELVQIMLRP